MNAFDLQMYIDGQWYDPARSERIPVHNPACTAQVVGSVPDGRAEDVDRAVAAAQRAQLDWAGLPLAERATHLAQAAARLASIDESGPRALTQEMGKILAESVMDFQSPPWVWSYYLDDLDGVERLLTERLSDEAGDLEIRRRPVGVVGAIVPWNWPIALLGVKLGPALLAGNTVVAVPSPFAPLGVLKAIEAIGDALPPGVVNVVTGAGERVGAALAAHPDVAMVAFTGGPEAGRSVAQTVAARLRRGVFELGGNDAAVLLDDVTVDDALVRQLATGFSMTSGQVCFAIKRLYVHESLFADVVARLGDALQETVVGDGLDPEVTMGPLANERQYKRFRAMLADAEAGGATVRVFGRKRDAASWDQGYFHLPALVTDVRSDERIVAEEQFGPALPIIPFCTDEEAVALANGTDYGLTASIWSADRSRAWELAGQIDAGVTAVNMHGFTSFDARAPFGGVKGSGYGREMGKDGLLEFTWAQQLNDRHSVQ
ncbi:aldehyde dehydrogenase family protein [Streptomyces sp. NBC_00841]|uniref:aldehyde dehydrogenase family protein n=1 Tax=Streptomyces sp. NBC_00841 TaxID=2975847 RepID=UPI002DD97692|nr:aldehyde dehydrogenase family protein [Streptomyces sp. NBC_00841]WRZ96781.1 aldehyde dehydrogenase family protein [Streptomyces sp. NBC_00841]